VAVKGSLQAPIDESTEQLCAAQTGCLSEAEMIPSHALSLTQQCGSTSQLNSAVSTAELSPAHKPFPMLLDSDGPSAVTVLITSVDDVEVAAGIVVQLAESLHSADCASLADSTASLSHTAALFNAISSLDNRSCNLSASAPGQPTQATRYLAV